MSLPVPIFDPDRAEVVEYVRPAGVEDVADAYAAASRSDWRTLPIAERANRMRWWTEALHARGFVLAEAERIGTGKPQHQAQGEVSTALDVLRFYAGAARLSTGPAAGRYLHQHHSDVRLDPLGIALAILPWNYPILLAAWRIGPMLAAGCPVVIKPDLSTPHSARTLAAEAERTLGPGTLQVVEGDEETGRVLVRSGGFAAIAFTGSREAGEDVARHAGLARVSLELGGNNAAIVLPDAPAYTAERLLDAVTYNAGQSCAAPGRVIAVGAAYDRFAEEYGAYLDVGTADFGPLHSEEARARYYALLAPHAAVVAPTRYAAGYRVPPALVPCAPTDAIATEEVFGPALPLLAAPDLDEAIRMANATQYGLAASVWTSDLRSAGEAAARLRAGEVWVNCHLVQTPELPHGGYGWSGSGTDMGADVIREYQRTKTVTTYLGGPG